MAVDVKDRAIWRAAESAAYARQRLPVWVVLLLALAAILTSDTDYFVQGVDVEKPADCVDVQHSGGTASGVYAVHPHGQPLDVYCDMTSGSGGWTVFLRRQDGTVNFLRNWAAYKGGFGDLSGEFWLGNELIHELTKTRNVSLRVDMKSFDGETRYAEYDEFSLEDEASSYTLYVAGFLNSSTVGDSLALPGWHSGVKFASPDRDEPQHHCASTYGGSWWYTKCFKSKLTGSYLRPGHYQFGKGIHWQAWHTGSTISLKRAEMKMKLTRTGNVTETKRLMRGKTQDRLPSRLRHDQIVMLESERALVIEALTCGLLSVCLQTHDTRTVYEVQFAASVPGQHAVYISHTDQTAREPATSTVDCGRRRRFWLSWAEGVVVAGEGSNPGRRELVRLRQSRDTDDVVAVATVVAKPSADITIYPVSAQFHVTPAVDLAASSRLSDADTETCMSLDVGQVYSQETKKWTRPITDRCWLPGVTIETFGDGGGTGSFTVTVVGRRITCDRQTLEVFMKHTDDQECGLRGSFQHCRLTSAGVSTDQLTTCVASCQCRAAKCNSPTVRFVTRREDAAVCEISVE